MMTRKSESRKKENERISAEGQIRGAKIKRGPGTDCKVDPARGNEFLARLLGLKMPMVPDPEPRLDPRELQTRLGSHDPVTAMLRAKPGFTREEAEQEIKDMGF
jgi:hypothetical protein